MAHDEVADGRSVVFRGGVVLTMDDQGTVFDGGDVLVVGDTIAAVGPSLEVPEGAFEVDARGGIVMPGMIDTHRHMWQTAMRAYGADWTLTQYFVWYYLEHGTQFRPEAISCPRGSRWKRASPRPWTGLTASSPSTMPMPQWTRSRPCPAGSSWRTATSRRARGSGPPTPR